DAVDDVDVYLAYVANVHIQRLYSQLAGLDDLAALLNVDGQALATAYRWVFSRDVGQAISRKQMKAAQRLLAQSSLSVSEIARKVGWENDSWEFYVVFRDYTGLS